ncbi:MAG TPA: TlpA disulfide reductase family protein [Bryobacteraceae bacterium]|nr:TlpA disulfide reductase family protein [Bryobacteraceae bacterium]
MVRTFIFSMLAPGLLLAADFNGNWDGFVVTNAARIPFRMEVSGPPARVCFFEDAEPICSTSVQVAGDSLVAQWDYLNSRLTLTAAAGVLSGTYVNLRTQRQIQIEAGPHQHSAAPSQPPANFAGEWEVHSVERPGPGNQLILRQSGTELKGTILRIDGDEGTLVGRVDGNQFAIAHFSGDRPAMLKGTLQADGSLALESGAQKLIALHPADARARNFAPPLDPMTYAHPKTPGEKFHFSFKDVDGKPYTEDSFAGKPYVVSITGSWCPNCRDEAPFLVELYRRYHSHGLEMAAFCFESAGDPTFAPLRAFVRRFHVEYPVLLAGELSEGVLKTAVPQIENLTAYPTTIYVGRDGTVRSVHTGFPSGGSGEELARVKEEIGATIERLIAEKPAGKAAR